MDENKQEQQELDGREEPLDRQGADEPSLCVDQEEDTKNDVKHDEGVPGFS